MVEKGETMCRFNGETPLDNVASVLLYTYPSMYLEEKYQLEHSNYRRVAQPETVELSEFYSTVHTRAGMR